MKKIFRSDEFVNGKKKNYFEGWYFRHTGDFPFSLIVGVSKGQIPHSFIQYIDNNTSHYFKFDLSDFKYNAKTKEINLNGNKFSESGINVHLDSKNLQIDAEIVYSKMQQFKRSLYSPSIMGPFSYLPMFCRHVVVSMSQNCYGQLSINGKNKEINCQGYIEKDLGNKFPDNYIWLHAMDNDTSIMFAVAWPLIFSIRGFLCIINHKGKQHNLSLYSGAKFSFSTNDTTKIHIKKGKTILEMEVDNNFGFPQQLVAPTAGGNMDKTIKENLQAKLDLQLKLNNRKIPTKITTCAFEEVIN